MPTEQQVRQSDQNQEAQAEQEKANKITEKKEEFIDKLFNIQFTAGTNIRYHQFYASRWSLIEKLTQIATGVSAFVGCIFAFSTFNPLLGQTFAVITAVMAVLLNVLPFCRWNQQHQDQFRQWSDLLEDVESVAVMIPNKLTTRDWDDLRSMNRKIYRIGAGETAPNIKRLEQFEAQEKSYRGCEN